MAAEHHEGRAEPVDDQAGVELGEPRAAAVGRKLENEVGQARHISILRERLQFGAQLPSVAMEKVNLAEKLALVDEPFRPRIVGYMNDYKLTVAKTRGEFVWHRHPETDDFFLVVSGELTIQLRDRDVVLGPGEMFVVPRGVEHCPRSDEGAEILLIEPVGTVNTGDAPPGPLTAEERPL
jgi:mannose-6-phosphate isomerase-like protein (cupin superfamily)